MKTFIKFLKKLFRLQCMHDTYGARGTAIRNVERGYLVQVCECCDCGEVFHVYISMKDGSVKREWDFKRVKCKHPHYETYGITTDLTERVDIHDCTCLECGERFKIFVGLDDGEVNR